MKTKAKNRGVSNQDQLKIDLLKIIEKKRRDLLTLSNSGLIKLFWEVGKALNSYADQINKGVQLRPVIHATSIQLTANYGTYFIEKNLKKMRQFAYQFPDFSDLVQVTPFISWEHFLLILELEDWDAKLFYMSLIKELQLSLTGLRKQISEKLFEESKVFKSKKNKEAFLKRSLGKTSMEAQRFSEKLKKVPKLKVPKLFDQDWIKVNIFKEPQLTSFRSLLELPQRHLMLTIKNGKLYGIEEELFGILSQPLEKFRHNQNNLLNTHLNLTFWEIGKRINHEILSSNNGSNYRQSVICNSSAKLSEKFSEKRLDEMSKFAEQFSDLGIASRIAYLISWEHILTLLPVHEMEAKLFYARLAATQGLSVASLQKKIAQNTYELTTNAKEKEQSLIKRIANLSIKRSVKTKKNVVVKVKTKFIDFGDDEESSLVTTNIFKNPFFPLLVF